jgi:hypothetical protein
MKVQLGKYVDLAYWGSLKRRDKQSDCASGMIGANEANE